MTTKIIVSLLIIGFFFMLTKVSAGMLGKNHPLSKVFPIGSTFLAIFLIGLMFLG